ncbi:alkane 1-monooxygenase [Rhodohalobacter sulfatireducens]|uniref:Alkane 1-monooxygenase n=1 Tax=Rhodohalobacter sulfatireducens TaxID=2911366 RepID=A0ABS9KJ70_9BACT|nr:alkane 1-monooxygenase [Rhodohalobacter sulfatireducens]MCG2590905.1 alkane 1-monooxygenase [Rhodohalobacter sulfatireducens]
MKAYSYIPSYTVPASAFIGIYLGGFWTFITPIYIFLLLPVAEWFAGENRYNLIPQEEERTKSSLGYSFLLWSHVPIQYFLTGYFLWICSTGQLTGWSLAGGILSVGISNGGVGITVAHELIHRSSRFKQWLGRTILLTTFYMHFAVEHVYGHHKHVATPDDPATAKKGEHFYRFWLRTVPGQYFSAWKIELKRLAKYGHSFFSIHNEMLLFLILQIGFLILIAVLFGGFVILPFMASCVVAFSLLEAVNYLEHYGLERRVKPGKGKYEKVDHHHSWNSDYLISRMFLFELSRHSDHHAVASRKYQLLRSFEESPQLPTGYPGMILIALFPPLWFRIMDPLVEKASKNH